MMQVHFRNLAKLHLENLYLQPSPVCRESSKSVLVEMGVVGSGPAPSMRVLSREELEVVVAISEAMFPEGPIPVSGLASAYSRSTSSGSVFSDVRGTKYVRGAGTFYIIVSSTFAIAFFSLLQGRVRKEGEKEVNKEVIFGDFRRSKCSEHVTKNLNT